MLTSEMTPEAQLRLALDPEVKKQLENIITDAFLQGVAETMMYVAAFFQRKMQKEDDA